MTYKGRQFSEKDEHKLMKAIIAQMMSYNDEQERKRQKKEMKTENVVEVIVGNVIDVSNKIDLVMVCQYKGNSRKQQQ